jgi:hypothetical protein
MGVIKNKWRIKGVGVYDEAKKTDRKECECMIFEGLTGPFLHPQLCEINYHNCEDTAYARIVPGRSKEKFSYQIIES